MTKKLIRFENEEALYQILNLIFYAMVGVPLMVFLFLYLQIKDGKFVVEQPDPNINLILVYLVPIFCLLNVVLAYVLYKNQLKNTAELDLRDKLQKFYYASLSKYSFLEAAVILTLIGLFLTGSMLYAMLYLILLMIFSLNRPTPYRLRKDLKIKSFPEKDKHEGKSNRML